MNENEENYNQLKKILIEDEGISLFGVAKISGEGIIQNLDRDYPYAISIGYRLSRGILETIRNAPNKLYFFHYQRVNIFLDNVMLKLVNIIQAKGYNAISVPASQLIEPGKEDIAISHKKIAWLAGHGWRGRNNLIVNPFFGSHIRYASLLTDLPLKNDIPLNDSYEIYSNLCGLCRKCIEVCPAGAIKEEGFDINLCKEKLKSFQKEFSLGHQVCGVCVKVCFPDRINKIGK